MVRIAEEHRTRHQRGDAGRDFHGSHIVLHGNIREEQRLDSTVIGWLKQNAERQRQPRLRVEHEEDVDGADKLIQLTLDVGEYGTRTVFAGIKSSYKPEDLDNRMVVLVNNLAPRQMKFGLSEGMVLASSNDNGIYLVSPDDGAEPGMKVR